MHTAEVDPSNKTKAINLMKILLKFSATYCICNNFVYWLKVAA